MHRILIPKIIAEGSAEDMHCLEEMLTELIDHMKDCDYAYYKRLEYKLYKMVYGDHLNEKLAHKWVDKMENKDGTKGAHWTIEQTNDYADKHNKFDWFAVLNMIYSDYYQPKFDLNTYVELARDWLNDSDVGSDKTLKYYWYVVC